jgi:hypothetical protein
MSPHYMHFRKEVLAHGKRKEIYIYFRGRLIYKQWQENGVKVASRVFHEGEGLTQFAK